MSIANAEISQFCLWLMWFFCSHGFVLITMVDLKHLAFGNQLLIACIVVPNVCSLLLSLDLRQHVGLFLHFIAAPWCWTWADVSASLTNAGGPYAVFAGQPRAAWGTTASQSKCMSERIFMYWSVCLSVCICLALCVRLLCHVVSHLLCYALLYQKAAFFVVAQLSALICADFHVGLEVNEGQCWEWKIKRHI